MSSHSNFPEEYDEEGFNRALQASLAESAEQARQAEEQELQRILEESRAEAERQEVQRLLEASRAEASHHSANEDAELHRLLEESRIEAERRAAEEEDETVRRLLAQSHADFIAAQTAQGAVADDDHAIMDAALKRSAEDWHRCTWGYTPPPEDSWEERAGIDLEPKGKGKGKRREETFYQEESHYQRSIAQGMQAMNLGGAAHSGYPPVPGYAPGPSPALGPGSIPQWGPTAPVPPPSRPSNSRHSTAGSASVRSALSAKSAAARSASGTPAPPPATPSPNVITYHPASATPSQASHPASPRTQIAASQRLADVRAQQQAAYAASVASDLAKKQADEDKLRQLVAVEKAEAQGTAGEEEKKDDEEEDEEEEPEDPEFVKQKRLAFLDRLGK